LGNLGDQALLHKAWPSLDLCKKKGQKLISGRRSMHNYKLRSDITQQLFFFNVVFEVTSCVIDAETKVTLHLFLIAIIKYCHERIDLGKYLFNSN
jgi:hypothetical protein